tara:strand:+ start:1266 stop:2828 length:1563 start_codon:yes stop_codon:yes gene_type:complete
MTSTLKVDNIANQSDSNIVSKCSTTITVGTGSDTTNVPGAAVVTGNVTGANVIASSNVVKSNALQASDAGNIISQSGTTITLGASGDTVSLASGASQSGFGRAGTVDWQTSIKTSNFDAVSGQGFFVNSGSGAITVTLPSSPSAGDIVSIADYGFNAATNNITINRNSEPIAGFSVNGVISVNGAAATLVYADGTKGWISVNDNTTGVVSQEYIAATGGTVTTVCTNFKVHVFNSPGTFCVSNAGNAAGSNTVDYLVIAGGGGGGGGEAGNGAGGGGGGGGAGGYRYAASTYTNPTTTGIMCAGSALPVTATGFPITVGGGGSGVPGHPSTAGTGNRGSNSVFSTITSTGGGGGGGCGSGNTPGNMPGGNGGGRDGDHNVTSGAGNTPPVSPPQGFKGRPQAPDRTGAGGGGAGGAPTACTAGATGGAGDTNAITGSGVARDGGGSGGSGGGPRPSNAGGPGGGGNGGAAASAGSASCAGGMTSGTSNTGGGGGGKGAGGTGVAGSGGSGVVIIRYKFQG